MGAGRQAWFMDGTPPDSQAAPLSARSPPSTPRLPGPAHLRPMLTASSVNWLMAVSRQSYSTCRARTGGVGWGQASCLASGAQPACRSHRPQTPSSGRHRSTAWPAQCHATAQRASAQHAEQRSRTQHSTHKHSAAQHACQVSMLMPQLPSSSNRKAPGRVRPLSAHPRAGPGTGRPSVGNPPSSAAGSAGRQAGTRLRSLQGLPPQGSTGGTCPGGAPTRAAGSASQGRESAHGCWWGSCLAWVQLQLGDLLLQPAQHSAGAVQLRGDYRHAWGTVCRQRRRRGAQRDRIEQGSKGRSLGVSPPPVLHMHVQSTGALQALLAQHSWAAKDARQRATKQAGATANPRTHASRCMVPFLGGDTRTHALTHTAPHPHTNTSPQPAPHLAPPTHCTR